jgi:hypothetical protein
MKPTTEAISYAVLLEQMINYEPNLENQFEAYGIMCQNLYNMYIDNVINLKVYTQSMLSLNEGRNLLLNKTNV